MLQWKDDYGEPMLGMSKHVFLVRCDPDTPSPDHIIFVRNLSNYLERSCWQRQNPNNLFAILILCDYQ